MDGKEKVRRIEQALDSLSGHERACRLCPRQCGVDRKAGEKGFCQSGRDATASHALLHYGEEPVLSGAHDFTEVMASSGKPAGPRGSGTIFFTGCNLKCRYCQNYQLSWLGQGMTVTDEELAGMMMRLQDADAFNINLVSPSHLILPILRALRIAYKLGLAIPLVYNSNGYENAGIIRHFEGIIDIYLPDLKYMSAAAAERYSTAPDYFSHASRAIQEMHRQKPQLIVDEAEIAREGLIVRHLILPGLAKDSVAILEWLVENFSSAVCLSLMSQYYPCHEAPPELRRPLQPQEYQEVLARAKEFGFETMFIQPELFNAEDHLIPDFSLSEPFRWEGKTKE